MDAFPGLAKQSQAESREANLQMFDLYKHFLWHQQRSWGMSNKAFLSLSIKKLAEECAVTSFGQQEELQKVGFNRLGNMVRLGQVR